MSEHILGMYRAKPGRQIFKKGNNSLLGHPAGIYVSYQGPHYVPMHQSRLLESRHQRGGK